MHADTMGSNDRTKVILMFGAVAVAAVVGIYYYFGIYAPNQRLADARSEIIEWDARWSAARGCLLRTAPGSSKVSEALAMRELSSDPWERKTCTQLVSALSRGEAVDTRMPAVEEAWRTLDKAASRVAVSFASHVDPGGDIRKKPDPLSTALDELEAAYAALRGTAELPPAPSTMDRKPLPAATIVPVQLGGKRLTSVQEPYVTSRAGLLAFGTVAGAEVQLQLVANHPPVVRAVAAGAQRAIPDASWGARAIPDAVEVGQLDAEGTFAAPAQLALPGPTQVLAVVGTWADGVVVYGAGNRLVVARCKAGTCTPDKPRLVRSMAFATDAATGDTTLVWADETSMQQALVLTAAALDTEVTSLGIAGFPKLLCLGADRAWLQYAREGDIVTAELAAGSASDVPDDEHALMGCSPGGAVLYADAPSYRRCAGGSCGAADPKATRTRVPVVVTAAGLVGVEARGAVLAVRKGGPTDFYAVPNGLVPIAAMTDGNTLDILGWTADGLVIARVSAR